MPQFAFETAFPYPVNAAPITGTSGNVAAATATATLAAASGKTTYITGFQVMAFGATAATGIITVTVAGTVTGSMTYTINVPAGAGVPVTPFPLTIQFPMPVPASAVNTAITVSMPTLGVGNTNAVINAQGYQL